MIFDERKTARPCFNFYAKDWLNDRALKMCSRAARSLWIDILCMMHFGVPYGVLTTEQGAAITIENLSKITGDSKKTLSKLLDELENNAIFSRDENGNILSRRMVRDEQKRMNDKQNGKSGGNPGLMGGVNPLGYPTPSRALARSSSVSSSVSKEEVKKASAVPAVKFVKPTLAEVKAYCLERKNNVDPVAWLARYESNGWRVGSNPMKNWKAAIVTWERNNFSVSKSHQEIESHHVNYIPSVEETQREMREIHGENWRTRK